LCLDPHIRSYHSYPVSHTVSLFSFSLLLFHPPGAPRVPHSFPTRRSSDLHRSGVARARNAGAEQARGELLIFLDDQQLAPGLLRSEEHTSELQSRENLVCRLLLEKKKKTHKTKVDTPPYSPPHPRTVHHSS